MKLLFLFPHFQSPGGAANVVLKFAKGLQEKDHLVEILCAKVSEEYISENPNLKFKQLHIPTSNSFFYWLFFPFWQYKINKQLKNYTGYILFPHVLPSNWWAWIFKRKRKDNRIAWYCHEPSAFIHSKPWINAIPNRFMKIGAKLLNPFLKNIDIALERKNDLVICNSNFTKDAYESIYKKEADGVIYPPITIRDILCEQNKEKIILTVGRLSKFKNIDLLLNAFSVIKNIFPDYKLVITGEGEEKENLENITLNLGLQSSVIFTGKVSAENLSDLYKKSRVTILCSRDEPFGLVPVESMMYYTPVIAHNSGGPRETIIHNENGFLYTDKNELITFINQIIEMDQEKYFLMQQRCREKALQYDITKVIEKLESVLSTI